MMSGMPAIPESTKTSLAQRLRAHAKQNWPQLTTVHVRYRTSLAYVDGELADGDLLPLMRLRYGGSAHHWGLAIHLASNNRYENQIWFTGNTEEALDLVCDLYVINTDH
jgi:hypothetical protein